MIYFVLDTGSGNVKIGWTDANPQQRLASLQTGCSAPLMLLGYGDGDRQTERILHAALRHDRLVGEWFKPSPALEGLFQSIATIESLTVDSLLWWRKRRDPRFAADWIRWEKEEPWRLNMIRSFLKLNLEGGDED